MSENKKLVFLSHIHEEKDLAIAFKEVIEASFLNMIEVFVSSDGTSITMGDKWLDSISAALQRCSIEIIACSLISVTRPWINFEAGAGWCRGIPVVPLCHSGMTPGKLPVPLRMLNGAVAGEEESVRHLFPVFAKALGCSVPRVDLAEYLDRVSAFERRYTFWEQCNHALRIANSFHPELFVHLRAGKSVTLPVEQKLLEEFESHADFLRDNKVLDYGGRKTIILGPQPQFECVVTPMAKFVETISAPECKL